MGLMDGKTVLATGATSGIGRAAARRMKEEGATVVALARDRTRASSQGFEAIECDLTSQASIRKAAANFLREHSKLDVLLLSAGVFLKDRSETVDGIEKTFAVNYLSHFLLANLVKDALVRGAPSRVIFVSSKYGGAKIDFDDLMLKKAKFSVMSSIPRTKLAEVLLMQELAEKWGPLGIKVNAIHPGLVAQTQLLVEVGGIWKFLTNFLGGTPEKGADTAVWLASTPEGGAMNGKLLEKRKPIPTPGQGSDPAARKRLWDESVKLAKLT